MANEQAPNGPTRPPKRPLTGWVLLLPLALLAGALWAARHQPDEPESPPIQSIAPNAVGPTPTAPKPNSTPAPTSHPALPPQTGVVLFLPGTDARLHRHIVSAAEAGPLVAAPGASYEKRATVALNLLLLKAKRIFPEGARPLPNAVHRTGDLVRVNFNKKFDDADFWSQSDTFAVLATGAITNTLAAVNSAKLEPIKVQILVEGKPVETLGEFDASDPLEPDMSLVTKS